jgi:fatty acyl-ACP thioesterase A
MTTTVSVTPSTRLAADARAGRLGRERQSHHPRARGNRAGRTRAASAATPSAEASDRTGETTFRGMEGTEWFSRAFENDGRKFREIFPVRFAEVGPNKEITMVTVADLIQECACNHAQGIWGVGQSMPAEMAKANLAWVCTRLHLRVREYPRWGEKVAVSTWFEPQGKIAARRDYAIEDSETGERLGEATSQWVVFNLGSRRMARIPNSVLEDFKYQALEQQVMEEEYTADKLPDLVEVGEACAMPITHNVRRSDMDMNGHVNNVVYVQWLLESVPPKTWEEHVLSEVILEYRSECNFGDSVTATCCELDEGTDKYVLLHKLERGEDTEIVRAKTVWLKKE